MNNVNSISQMNSVACEHSSLIGHEAGKRPASAMMPGEKGPEGKHMFLVKSYFFQNTPKSNAIDPTGLDAFCRQDTNKTDHVLQCYQQLY